MEHRDRDSKDTPLLPGTRFRVHDGVPIVTEQNPTNFWGSRKRSPPQWSESGDQCFDGRDTFETFVLLFGAVFLEETGAGVWSGAGKYR
jgi:hypothetical protein